MERYKKIIARASPILELLEQGIKPEDIKREVIESLNPFFENKELLKTCSIDFLIPESVTLQIVKDDGRFVGELEKCLLSYRLAKAKQPMNCFKSIALLEPEIAQSNSKFWSILNLEVNKSSLRLDEFLHECLRNIGDFIEDLAKPYLKFLLLQLRIARMEENWSANIDSLDLGEIINELIQKSSSVEMFSPAPWNIRLNQWRNIARHGTAKIDKEEIICQYGVAPRITEIRLTRDNLLEVNKTIYLIYLVLKLAYSIFTIDNVEEIRKHVRFAEQREEAEFVSFVAAIASQGFEIVDYNVTPEEARLIVKDRTSFDPNKRRIHASQFLFPLWNLSRSKKMGVEYLENNGSPNSVFRVSADICEKHFNGELNVQEFAMKIEFLDLRK